VADNSNRFSPQLSQKLIVRINEIIDWPGAVARAEAYAGPNRRRESSGPDAAPTIRRQIAGQHPRLLAGRGPPQYKPPASFTGVYKV